MRPIDLLLFAYANVRRNRSRSLLTLVGVAIGVTALVTLVAYGNGLQENANKEFEALELYNTLRITSRPMPFSTFGEVAALQKKEVSEGEIEVSITDSLLRVIAAEEGVLAAYPEVLFPVEIVYGDFETIATAEAIPMAYEQIPSYQLEVGQFFESDTVSSILLAPAMARRLGFEDPELIVGEVVLIRTATLDFPALVRSLATLGMGLQALPLKSESHPMRVAGLLEESAQPITGYLRILMPLARASTMRKVTFFSTIDILLQQTKEGGYIAGRVQLRDNSQLSVVSERIAAHGVYVTSFREQYRQIERLFLVLDLALAIIGFIAVLVATVGIANTLMMSVMERYQEIGVMKAVGGEEGDILRVFLIEGILLGLSGAVIGTAMGWLIMGLINWVVDQYLIQLGIHHIELFSLTIPLVVGMMGLVAVVSFLAGVLPARRAAKISPIEALRYN